MLKSVGIVENFGTWISTFISERTQAVKIGGTISDSVEIMSGVPQGSVSGQFFSYSIYQI